MAIIYPEGMRLWPKNKNAPDFIKGQITVRVSEFAQWAKDKVDEKGVVRLDVKEGRDGELYLALNTYRKQEEQAAPKESEDQIPF